MIRWLLIVALFWFQGTAWVLAKPNVLFIAVDDLRPELACYGKSHIHSPNIDKLAQTGFLFERAYCMVPTCGASRASLMTGVRPTRGRFVSYLASAEKEVPEVMTLNTHFKNNGYHTVSNGKIFHHREDNARGWSEEVWRPKGNGLGYRLEANQKIHKERGKMKGRRRRGSPYESADAPDLDYPDGQIAEKTIADLRRLKNKEEPFFLAVGFLKPHLPFVAPKKYWDLYDHDDIHLPKNYYPPKDVPKGTVHAYGELRAYAGVPAKGPVSDEMARNLIHGYYACVSFTDAQVGKVLDELEKLGLAEDTIVILWGDHGWNLAEHTMWCKHSCFETSMHAPLIVRAPGVGKPGQRTRALTEFIDIYPSLSELAGLPLPEHLQGKSFVPLLKNPELPWKSSAIGRYINGDTIRTDRFRFSEYTGKDGKFVSRMLYDHQLDPDENINISEQASQLETVEKLTQDLRKYRTSSKEGRSKK
ncbi:MAG: sulfatase [Verrucomicrobiales bacterium]|nr:sulfatase [Verrucomicrobiales bacterium]